MKSRQSGLVRNAHIRANVISALGKDDALNGLSRSDLIKELKRRRVTLKHENSLDAVLKNMVVNRLIKHHGKPRVYRLVTTSPAVVEGRVDATPKLKAPNGAAPTISVDFDRANGRLRLRVVGPLDIDLGVL